jgi:hypothetical protein
MGFFVQLLELVAVFLPDPLTLGLFTLALFNLWWMTKTLYVAGTLNTDTALGISLALGYLVAIAINIFSSVQASAPSRRTTLAHSKSSVEWVRRDSVPETLRGQPVKHRSSLIEP